MSFVKGKQRNISFNLKNILSFRPLKGQNDNIITLLKPQEPEMELYKKRIYRTWDEVEINLIRDKIRTAIKNNDGVNITELHEFMMYRTLDGIRSKVHGYAQRYFHKTIWTYTV